MFDQLSGRLDGVFKKLTGRGVLSEKDIDAAMREIRIALLEADVALPVIKTLIKKVKEDAVGEKVLKSIKPGEQVVKIVNDKLVEILGEGEGLNLATQPPAVVMMVGLQGSGKTTTTGKIAKRLKEKEKKKVLLASLDIYRPAAQQQLQTLAERTGVDGLEIVEGQKPVEIAKRALKAAKTGGYDVLFLDTAGRLEIDEDLMAELETVKQLVNPVETLLVVDSLTGQVAVNVAKTFHERIGITGNVLTRIDGDGRGGAALSMREMTGCPIKFLGMGEGLGALEVFRPESMANRILGMGDVVSLVEKVQEATSEEDMMGMMEKMLSGQFDLNDMKKQMKMMQRMGSLKGMMKLIPGVSKMAKQLDQANVDDKMVVHQIAIIDSMTKQERKNPSILNAKRRQRIAKGCGLEVSAVNKLIKSHQQMQKMMKKMQSGGMGGLGSMFGGGGGFPPMGR
ncbi:MAG: signal recognition particle protein [Magnetococcales bacterium]|nr:signal recognition particle protein [Magnetococcales bacterium]|tara:strand:- start:4323 stop:5681 length:1359 start_codon:yes stop_codon:yes gene_type:complete